MQLAAAEAFGEAVATPFPARSSCSPRCSRRRRSAAHSSRGGRAACARIASTAACRRSSVTAQIADALPTFGGATLGAVLRAAGATFPIRARMHIYQSAAGTTLPRMVRLDRANASGRGYVTHVQRASADARRGGHAAARTAARRRGPAGVPALAQPDRGGPALLRARTDGRRRRARAAGHARESRRRRAACPESRWITANLRKSRVTVGFYLSEAECAGRRRSDPPGPWRSRAAEAVRVRLPRDESQRRRARRRHIRVVREDGEAFEELAARAGRLPALRRAAPPARARGCCPRWPPGCATTAKRSRAPPRTPIRA